jgi:F-type H+-transporting ATPase subunit delta
MKDPIVARRYAAALFEVARQDDAIDVVWADLTAVERELTNSPSLRDVLLHPLATQERKLYFTDKAFGDRISAATLSFLKLLIRKNREGLIDVCISEYRDLVEGLHNQVDAVASSAVPLTELQSNKLVEALKVMTGKSVNLSQNLDPSVIGGVVVRIGDTIIDGSLRGRLRRLEEQLLGATYTERG